MECCWGLFIFKGEDDEDLEKWLRSSTVLIFVIISSLDFVFETNNNLANTYIDTMTTAAKKKLVVCGGNGFLGMS